MIFVATKTPALPMVTPQLKEIFFPGIRVISFQNGIGAEDYLAAALGAHHVSRGIVNYAGNINQETGEITMNWFHPPILLGPAEQHPRYSVRLSASTQGVGSLSRVAAHLRS